MTDLSFLCYPHHPSSHSRPFETSTRILTIQGNLDAVINVLQNVLPSLEEVPTPFFLSASFCSVLFFCFRMPLIFTTQGFQDSRRTDWTRWRLGCPSLGSPEPNWLHYRTRWSQSEGTPWGIRPFYFFLIDLNHVWLMKNCLFGFVATMRLVCFLLTTATCFAENLRQNKFHLKWADEWSPR
jgi:hypothetical protein